MTLDEVHAAYSQALERARAGQPPKTPSAGGREIALAVALAMDDARSGAVRSRSALADAIERTLGVVLDAPRPRGAADLRPVLDRDALEELARQQPGALHALGRRRRRP